MVTYSKETGLSLQTFNFVQERQKQWFILTRLTLSVFEAMAS